MPMSSRRSVGENRQSYCAVPGPMGPSTDMLMSFLGSLLSRRDGRLLNGASLNLYYAVLCVYNWGTTFRLYIVNSRRGFILGYFYMDDEGSWMDWFFTITVPLSPRSSLFLDHTPLGKWMCSIYGSWKTWLSALSNQDVLVLHLICRWADQDGLHQTEWDLHILFGISWM